MKKYSVPALVFRTQWLEDNFRTRWVEDNYPMVLSTSGQPLLVWFEEECMKKMRADGSWIDRQAERRLRCMLEEKMDAEDLAYVTAEEVVQRTHDERRCKVK